MSRSDLFLWTPSRKSSWWRLCGRSILLLFVFLSLFPDLAPEVHASRVATTTASRRFAATAAYSISGTVFDDYNENGTQDNTTSLVEPGINGVVVTAYNAAGTAVTSATSSTVSGVLGQYTLSIPSGTGPVRVQFSNFGSTSTITDLQGLQQSTHVGGTTVQFVSGASSTNTINLGLERPSEYCQNQPTLSTNCYIIGDQTTTGQHVLVSFPSSASGTTPAPTALADSTDVGSTWGLAYRRSSDSLFASAYLKRHSGFKPSGSTGAIYLISSASSCSPSCAPTLFVDLNVAVGAGIAGTNYHNTGNYTTDANAYDQIGKASLGGMALSDDETTLYVMNLADKKLYAIAVGTPPAVPVAGTITSTALPSLPTSSCPTSSDIRPFAVTSYHGLIYVGAVCSAESTVTGSLPLGDPSKLQAYIFVYTPGHGFTSSPAFQTSLNYTRHCANDESYSDCTASGTANIDVGNPANWNPWHPGFIGYRDLGHNSTQQFTDYPQPMLTTIAFDNGNLLLGIRDRFGDQTGSGQLTPDGTRTIYGVPAADALRACLSAPDTFSYNWTLENNATCGTKPDGTVIQTAGKNNTRLGPGGGQYYFHNYHSSYHDNTAMGSVLQIPGSPSMITTIFDPIVGATTLSAGIRVEDNTTAAMANSYQIYTTAFPTTTTSFGKANGLGALVALCQSAPLEIGHRVWLDSSANGIQDPGEPGIAGATVDLYQSDGTTLISSTTTDSTGAYYFSLLNTDAYKSYVVKLDHAADYASGGVLQAYRLTTANQDTSTHLIDSKATLPTPALAIGSGNYPTISVSTMTPGQYADAFDFGLTLRPDISLTKTVPSATTFQVGHSVTYTLTPTNSSSAGSVPSGDSIVLSDPIPAGLTGLTATASVPADWTLSLSGTTSPTTLTATYKGTYPVASGATMSAITLTGTLTTAALAPTPAPAGYWAFNENSGTSAYDYSSNHNTGTLTGSPTWVPGAVNSALSFNGSSNYVTMGNLSALQFGTGSFTAMASFKTTSTSGFTRLFNQGVGSWNGGFNMGMNAFCSGCLSATIGGGGSGTTSTVVGTSTNLADGKWHQAAMVIDGTAKTVQLYVDGVTQTISVQGSTCGTSPTTTTVSISSCSSLTANTTDPFIVGAYNGTSGTFQYFNGSLDEVRVYGSALTSSQIQNLYTAASLTNTATISTPNDSNTANNTATSTITVVPQPDVSLTKTVKTNLAFKETVTSNNSYETSDWGVTRLTDGITTSMTGTLGYTSNGFSTSDASSSPPYVDIDLGTNQTFSSVVLYPRTDTPATGGGTAGFPVAFTIQVAPNGSSTYTTVDTITSQANPNGVPQTYSFASTTDRHVRVVVTTLGSQASGDGYYRFQLAEMQVY